MKSTRILYWLCTLLLVPALGMGSVMELMGNPDSLALMATLGYPAYLSPFLGLARILALIALLVPGFPRLKEWAYAGLVFDLVGVIYSFIAVKFPPEYFIFPVIILGLIFSSYFLYHKKEKS